MYSSLTLPKGSVVAYTAYASGTCKCFKVAPLKFCQNIGRNGFIVVIVGSLGTFSNSFVCRHGHEGLLPFEFPAKLGRLP